MGARPPSGSRSSPTAAPSAAWCSPATYGYAGSERDLRGTKIIPAGFLSPQAIRMKLLACLAAGLDVDETRWAFRQDDG